MENQTIAQLKETARNIRQLQSNAMNMRNAGQFGRLEKELESIYKKIDLLQQANRTNRITNDSFGTRQLWSAPLPESK